MIALLRNDDGVESTGEGRIVWRLLAATLLVATAGVAWAASGLRPVVPEADGYSPIPGAAMAPDPARTYRMVFDARKGADRPGKLAPAINLAAAELNTLVASRIPANRIQIAIVFHAAEADDALLDDAHYRREHGVENPNLKPLAEMHRAGVRLYVCGQQLKADGVDFKTLSRDVTVVADGLVALTLLQNHGYAVLVF